MSIRNRLLLIKNVLPWNGDWLYVTLRSSYNPKAYIQPTVDLASKYDTIKDATRNIASITELNCAKSFYDWSKDHAAIVADIAHSQTKKASVILTMSSLAAVLVMAAGSTMGKSEPPYSLNIYVIASVILALCVMHFMRAAIYSLSLVAKDQACYTSADEMIAAFSCNDMVKAWNCASASVLVSANKYHSLILTRTNRAIIAVESFRWGIIWLIILAVLYFATEFIHRTGYLSSRS